jgi:calcineurin-like phosphoesterase family protein
MAKTPPDFMSLITEDTWIISDHHFGHKNIGEWEPNRVERAKELGFETFEDMLIYNHNKTVAKTDICLFLGDFSFSSPSLWVSKLNGTKILIRGNHDSRGNQAYNDFDFVVDGIHVDWNGRTFIHRTDDFLLSAVIKNIKDKACIFSHYPLWFKDEYIKRDGTKLIDRIKILEEVADTHCVEKIFHGHLHSKLAVNPNVMVDYINTCCEHQDYTPRKIGELLNEESDE